MRGVLCLVISWSLAAPTDAQQFVERVFKDASGDHKYQVFIPAGYVAGRETPTILFLHGAGERGTDGQKQVLVGLGPYVKAWGNRFPFLAVFPQAEDTRGRLLTPWQAGQPDAERALKILDAVEQDFSVDTKRISLVGWSMGGYGAWSLGAAHPDRWNAVMALSGGGDPSQVAALKETPVWAFHGDKDALVPARASREMVEALREAGGKVTLTEFPNGGHVIFDETFGNESVLKWLADPQNSPAELAANPTPLKLVAPPFVPALEIPDAVGIRLGNDALNAISYAAPSLIPPGMLSGRLNDMFDSTTAQGRTFSVRFSGISYYGQLERVQIRAVGTNRVNVQLGLRNIILSIAGTSVSGARQSAQAGTINVGIGHNRTVWLSIDVAPTIENRQLRLRLLGSSFSIPADSYYVTQPAGVSVQGLGMTRERVVSGLVSGLYGARYRVENEVRAVVPNIVLELERQLTLADPGPIVAGMWPLPVYEPRLRAYPTQVRTDADGISLVLGIAAADFDLAAKPATPQVAASAGITLDQLQGTTLGVAIVPDLMRPLSKLLIDDGMARINLLDLPSEGFRRLAERKTLMEVFPALSQLDEQAEIRTELAFLAPLEMSLTSETEEAPDNRVPLKFQFPKAALQFSVRDPGASADWKPYAEFDLDISDQVAASLREPSHERRQFELEWLSGASIRGTGRYAEGAVHAGTELQSERLVELFTKAWQEWTQGGPTSQSAIPDLEFSRTKLRMESLSSTGPAIEGRFDIPTIKLTNLSEEPFIYETKGPYSAWGGPYTLKPGESQEYKIPYPLTYRHASPNSSQAEVYTLYVGTHSEFRVPRTGGAPRLFTAREPELAEPVSTP